MRPARDHSAYDLGYSRDGGSDKSKSSGGLIRTWRRMTSLQQVVVGVAGLLAIVYVVSGSGDTSNGSNGDGSVGFADAGTRGGASAQELASAVDKLDTENRMLRSMLGEVQKEQQKQLQSAAAAAAAAAAAPAPAPARPKRGPPSREVVAQRHEQQPPPPPPPPPYRPPPPPPPPYRPPPPPPAKVADPYAADNKVKQAPSQPEEGGGAPGGRGGGNSKLKLGEYPGPMNAKQEAVVKTMKWAWKGYKEFAWGKDELLPVSKKSSEWFNLGLTLIDSLDTMLLMGMQKEYAEAREWVNTELRLDQNKDVNLFECTIRVLGGLISTYWLSGKDVMYKEKARDLGDRLMHAFNPKSGVPYSDVNLGTHNAHKPKWGSDSSTSEVTTIQLEFRELSRITGDPKYDNAVTQVMEHVRGLPKKDGLVPIFINANTGKFSGNTITLGARGDSYYEYLLKQWLQSDRKDDRWKNMYTETVDGIFKHLVKESSPNKLTYLGELINGSPSPKMDHLVCFMPGTLALGTANGLPESHMDLAKKLMKTCYEMYRQMPIGLAPEIAHFNTNGKGNDLIIKDADAHNLLRPETVESLFIMHRLTKDPVYVEWGWEIYLKFEKYCRVDTGGYSSLHSVKKDPPSMRNKMESFFLGETLKYLFLLFEEPGADQLVPLDRWVFNTEAHPLPIFNKDETAV